MSETLVNDRNATGENQESSDQKADEAKQYPQKRSKRKQKWKKMDLSVEPTTSYHEEKYQSQQPLGHNASGTRAISLSQHNTTNYSARKTLEAARAETIRRAAGLTIPREENIALSKALARLLRHRKPHNIPIDDEGYALIDHIIHHREFARFNASVDDIKHLVDDNSKRRFELKYNSDGKPYKIKATQGHSVQFRDFQLDLIRDPFKHAVVVHGTYKKNWRLIKKEGLKRLGRTHIHFAIGLIGQTHVTSGMRNTCDVVIYLNMEKAMKDGLKFYESSNNVVLCEGNESGVILPKYFSKVTQWNEKQQDWFEVALNEE